MSAEIQAVLFDIDDTLVDLETAMGRTLHHIAGDSFSHLSEAEWVEYKRLFSKDPLGHYDSFLTGEITFAEQRLLRARHAQESLMVEPLVGAAARRWTTAYEATLPLHFAAYEDVVPLLDELDARGIDYGAISNNVHDYQRAKLDRAGLDRVKALVGIDTVNAAKPDPAIFREGARLVQADPARTLYIGDNYLIDARGADDAGLVGVWLNRPGVVAPASTVRSVTTLHDVLQFLPDIR